MMTANAQVVRTDQRALLAMGTTVLLWASAFVVIRDYGADFAAGGMALGRLLAGSVVLAGLLLLRREGLPARAAWPGIALSGVMWFGLYMISLNWGEQHVDAGTASMVVNIGPILIALLGGWVLKEGFPRGLLAGIAVSFCGVVLVGLASASSGRHSVIGILLCLVAAMSYAVGVVSQKRALRHASAVQVTTFGCVIGMICCLPFTGQFAGELARAPVPAIVGVFYLGLFPTALAFSTWAYALARMPAGKTGATTYLVPAVVVVISAIFLREVPGWLGFVGGALCLVGVAVTRSRGQSAGPASEPAEYGEATG